jgi:hypothetical protein
MFILILNPSLKIIILARKEFNERAALMKNVCTSTGMHHATKAHQQPKNFTRTTLKRLWNFGWSLHVATDKVKKDFSANWLR